MSVRRTSEIKHKETSYFPELDGIRALAVLAVLFYHLGLNVFSGGFIGVDIFFVLSGYLISLKIIEQLEQGTFSLFDFYKRRFFRLFPAILATVLCVLLVGIVFLPIEPLIALAKSAGLAIASVVNIYFFRQAGYWDQSSATKPLLHFWSLSVEEQFYLVWPLLLWFTYSKFGKNKSTLTKILVVIGVLSFATSEYNLLKGRFGAFYLMPYRTWEFSLGGLLALLYCPQQRTLANLKVDGRNLCNLMSLAALAGWIFSIVSLSSKSTYPGLNALIPSVATILIIVFARGSWVWPILTNRLASYIGKISFAIYLVHWPLIVFYKDLKFLEVPSLNAMEVLALFFVTLLVASLLKIFIENPFRLNKFSSPLFRRLTAGIGAILSVGLSLWILSTNGLPFRIDATRISEHGIDQKLHRCSFRYQSANWKEDCGIGLNKPQPDIVLLGDSHMNQYMPGFDRTLSEMKLSGLILTHGGSLPIPNGTSLVMGEKFAIFDGLYQRLLKKPPKLVILSARWDAPFKEEIPDYPGVLPNRFMFGENTSKEVESSRQAVQTGLREFLAELNRRNINTLVLGQVPLPVKNIGDCLMRPKYLSRFAQSCTVVDAESQMTYQSIVMEALQASTNSLSRVHLVDLGKELCNKNRCVIYSDSGALIYSDTNHLSDSGGAYVVSHFIKPYIEKLIKIAPVALAQPATKALF